MILDHRYAQRTSGPAHVRSAEVVVLHRLVHRQNLVPTPARVSPLDQPIEVGFGPTGPHHAVDGGRTAQQLAAGPVLDLTTRADRLCLVVVGVAVALEREEESLGDVDHRTPVAAAVLQQQDLILGILRQPVGQHRAPRSGADDDVVVDHFVHPLSM